MGQLDGLTDKLYWRPEANHVWHCYKKVAWKRWMSLCARSDRKFAGGQDNARPPMPLRCACCDSREASRRGWSESGQPNREWIDHYRANYGEDPPESLQQLADEDYGRRPKRYENDEPA